MFPLVLLYAVVLTSMTGVGYKHLSIDYKKLSKDTKGLVYKLAPVNRNIKISGVVGEMTLEFNDLNFNYKLNDQAESGPGRIICVKLKMREDHYRLAVQIADHVYKNEYLTLEEFGVENNCRDKSHFKGMFEVLRIENSKYSLAFKDTEGNCFVRTLQVIEEELEVFVNRQKPEMKPCSEINERFEINKGYVIQDSWMEDGVVLTMYDLNGKNMFLMKSNTHDIGSEWAQYTICKPVEDNKDSSGSYKVVNIRLGHCLLDLVVTNTCDYKLLHETIVGTAVEIKKGEIKGKTSVFYRSPGFWCYKRNYECTVEPVKLEGLTYMRRVTVQRSEEEKVMCWAHDVAEFFVRTYNEKKFW